MNTKVTNSSIKISLLMIALSGIGCSDTNTPTEATTRSVTTEATTAVTTAATTEINIQEQAKAAAENSATLDAILLAQTAETKARYIYRHPKQTLDFFGIKPGMTVVEVLPGGGWYSKILAPYLGAQGHLIGINYPDRLWSNFDWAKPEFIAERIKATQTFSAEVKTWAPKNTPTVSSYTFDTLPAKLTASADVALYIRALHNLNRFNTEHQFLDQALGETYRILKPGGMLGVVQHQTDAENLDGSRGYLNKSELIATLEKSGFSLVAESGINTNPKDQPSADDIVWRLPPSYYTSADDEPAKEKYRAIGESNRMTLLFKKR